MARDFDRDGDFFGEDGGLMIRLPDTSEMSQIQLMIEWDCVMISYWDRADEDHYLFDLQGADTRRCFRFQSGDDFVRKSMVLPDMTAEGEPRRMIRLQNRLPLYL